MTVSGTDRLDTYVWCTMNSENCQPTKILDGEIRFMPEHFFGALTAEDDPLPWIQLDLQEEKDVTQVMPTAQSTFRVWVFF